MPVIEIDTASRYQKIDGFGATFNEAGHDLSQLT